MKRARFYAVGFSLLMIVDTFTQVAFKLASTEAGAFSLTSLWLKGALHAPWMYAAIGGYLITFFTWMTLLKHAPVGPAFAASHLEIVTVLIISVPLFGERLTPLQMTGAVSIVTGIVLLTVGGATGESSDRGQ